MQKWKTITLMKNQQIFMLHAVEKEFRNNFFHLPGSQLFDCRRLPPQIYSKNTK
jgi:hypothetical protein